jgi:hypothetical protein
MLENIKQNISQIKCFGRRCNMSFWAFSNTLSTFYFQQVISKQIPKPQIICLIWIFIVYFKPMREIQVTQCFSFQFVLCTGVNTRAMLVAFLTQFWREKTRSVRRRQKHRTPLSTNGFHLRFCFRLVEDSIIQYSIFTIAIRMLTTPGSIYTFGSGKLKIDVMGY